MDRNTSGQGGGRTRTRREFLRVGAAGAAGLLAGQRAARSRAADSLGADLVQLSPEIEPLVRLIEETSRERCFEAIGGELARGLSYRQFLAALFLAGIRNVNPQPPGFKFHCVFVIHSAHQLSLDAPTHDRLLPLLWALDNFKASQERDVAEGDFRLRPPAGPLPSPAQARQEFLDAMEAWDEERADRAIVALVRTCGAHEVIEVLWRFGMRDYRNIGHKAIFVANAWRTLETIGWHHAEPVLRSLVLGLLDFGTDRHVNGYAYQDQSYPLNEALARQAMPKLSADWTLRRPDPQVARNLLEVIRTASVEEACSAALAALVEKRAGAQSVWDAVHLAAGELMMRQPGIYGIHTVTSANALHYAYRNSADVQTRLLALLQGVGWMGQFTRFMAEAKGGLGSQRITEIGGASLPESEETAIGEVLSSIGVAPARAASQAFELGRRHPDPARFAAAARRLIFRKATDAHDYKYPAAIFEDYGLVSPPWRPHMLATSVYHLQGVRQPDSPLMQRASQMVQSLGSAAS